MKQALAFVPALVLAACAGAYGGPDAVEASRDPIKRLVSGTCDAARVQHHAGDKVTQELGLVIREVSGAQRIRWGPPGAAWTMDYRDDRVNIRYDAQMKITAITCG